MRLLTLCRRNCVRLVCADPGSYGGGRPLHTITMLKSVTRVEAHRNSALTISTMAVLFILMSLTLGLGISYLLLRAFLLLLS